MRKTHRLLTTLFVNIILTFYLALQGIVPILPVSPVSAADFDIVVNRVLTVPETGMAIQVSETRTVTNRSASYYIPAGSIETFSIQSFKEGFEDTERKQKEQTIKLTNAKGKPIPFTTELQDTTILVKATYPSNVEYGSSFSFILSYETNELREKVGSVTNVFIPGLSTEFTGDSTDPTTKTVTNIAYQTSLVVPLSMGEKSFTLPEPDSITSTAQNTIYSFNTESLIGTTVWHQIGDHQTYFFKMTQPIHKSDQYTPEQLSFLSKAEYELILPRDYSETNQKVFFSKIEPKPDKISLDDDGNVIATFFMDATKEGRIDVEGYITVSTEEDLTGGMDANNATVEEILRSDPSMSSYLKSAQFWEVSAPEIHAKALELSQGKTRILDILKADYEFIVQSIDYDDFKYGDRNTRRGALATLKGGSSVCMEYSDLLIALARAQGIPARAAYGYGYDPKLPPDQQEEHQWVQTWVPHYGWLTIDPTWGETGREFIGKDLDHALWYVASINPNLPSPLKVTAATTDFILENSIIEITAVDGIPEGISLKTLTQISSDAGDTQSGSVEFLRHVQTSMMGRTLVIILPVVVLLVGLTIVGKILSFLFKPRRKLSASSLPKNTTQESFTVSPNASSHSPYQPITSPSGTVKAPGNTTSTQ